MRTGRGIGAMLGWVAAAVVAGSVAIAIVGWLGSSISTPAPSSLSAEEVRRELSTAPDPGGGGAGRPTDGSAEPSGTAGATGSESGSPTATPSVPSPSAAETSTPAPDPTATQPEPTVKVHPSGTVSARCVGSQPRIVYANPAQGFQDDGVDDDDRDDDGDDGDSSGSSGADSADSAGSAGSLTLKFSSENRDAFFMVRCNGAKAVIGVTTKVDD